MLKIDAMIKYYFKTDTKNMSDDEWALSFNQIVWSLVREKKLNPNN